jgi:hypothetical protein
VNKSDCEFCKLSIYLKTYHRLSQAALFEIVVSLATTAWCLDHLLLLLISFIFFKFGDITDKLEVPEEPQETIDGFWMPVYS